MIRRAFLFALVLVSAFTVCAGDPTPESETDLPTNVTAAVNGTTLPEDIGETVADAVHSGVGAVFDSSKRDVLYSIGTLLKLLDDPDFEKLFSSFGYGVFRGSGDDREIYLTGFFGMKADGVTPLDDLPTPNEFADRLYAVVHKHVENALNEYIDRLLHDGDSLLRYANGKATLKAFECSIDLGLIGEWGLEDGSGTGSYVYIDRGDVCVVVALLRVVESAVSFLRGMDFGDLEVTDIIDIVGNIIDITSIDGYAMEDLFNEIIALLKILKARPDGQAYLTAAQGYLTEAIDHLKTADQVIRSRTDAHGHILGKVDNPEDEATSRHLISYCPTNGIISVIRDHADVIKAILTEKSTTVRKEWLNGIVTVWPTWLAKDEYAFSLAPLFSASFDPVSFFPEAEGDWLVMDSVRDPTFGGLLPGFTLAEAYAIFEVLKVNELWSYETYRTYGISMPYLDGTAGTRACPRRIAMTVTGEGTVEYYSALENANGGSALQLYVDGMEVENRRGSGGRKTHHGYWIAGEGEHELVWEYTGPTDEDGKYLREETAGVHPLGDVTWTKEPKPAVPPSWSLATKEEVWAVLDGFETGDELKGVISTSGEYGDLRNWLGWAKDATHKDMNAVAQDPRMAMSYKLVLAGIVQGGEGAAHLFAEEPKIEIGELTVDGSGPRMTVRVTDGETLVRAAKAIEEKVQVCTDLGKGSWQKATATAIVNGDGTATISVSPPNGDSCFLRVKAE